MRLFFTMLAVADFAASFRRELMLFHAAADID